MAKSCKRKCKRHHKTRRHRQRGGELGSNPPSAWGWSLGTLGDGLTQFKNALTGDINQSNNIVPIGHNNNQNMNSKTGGRKKYRGGNTNMPMPSSMNSSMPSMPMNSIPVSVSMPVSMPPKTGGRKRRTRGGNVIAQAIVPASLILMNNALGKYSRRKSQNRR